MANLKRFFLLTLLTVSWSVLSSAQDTPKREEFAPGAKCWIAEHEAPAKSNAITKEQADAIVGELKQIRQLLEKQQALLARSMTPPSMAALAPPGKVQVSMANGSYAVGRADAPATLLEFGDFQCSFCKRFHADAYPQLKKNYIDTGKLRFVSRDLPLEFHPLALKAAEAARCAGDQGKYWDFRDALYADAMPPSDEVIQRVAASLSLDRQHFSACLASDKYRADVEKDASEAAALQISGTPTFVLGKTAKDKLDGVRIVGALPFTAFQSAIEDLLKNPPQDALKGKAN